ncbi:unnamed protein product [Pleuronectes platessa]|uniref:Uncharacterized protein n=1 Tax=Pleuronectes platessa TaxID=8262 RepID=A0A9N7YR00_PLEPL|nr:unnamed protein product [Pleuronectes platessa]
MNPSSSEWLRLIFIAVWQQMLRDVSGGLGGFNSILTTSTLTHGFVHASSTPSASSLCQEGLTWGPDDTKRLSPEAGGHFLSAAVTMEMDHRRKKQDVFPVSNVLKLVLTSSLISSSDKVPTRSVQQIVAGENPDGIRQLHVSLDPNLSAEPRVT